MKSFKQPKFWISFVVLSVASIALFQNCGKGFEAGSEGALTSLSLGSLDANCINNTANDSCIYYKNPIAHMSFMEMNIPVDQLYDPGAMAAYQTYAVQLNGLKDPKRLEDANFAVVDASGLVAESDLGWRLPYSMGTEPLLGAVSSYFYADKMNRFYSGLKKDYVSGKNIRIVVDSDFSGWSHLNSTIYLGLSNGVRSSMDASAVVHLVNEAAISYATNGAIYDLSTDTKHVDCGKAAGPVYAKDCCSSSLGCSKAVTAGLSDYVVATLFPEHTGIAEHIAHEAGGMMVCSGVRNVASVSTLTAQEAYDACADTQRSGQVFAMGNFYGSVWWEVHNTIKTQNPALLGSLNRIYAELIPMLTADDDFVTTLGKIRVLDDLYTKSKIAPYFEAEYNKRNLALN